MFARQSANTVILRIRTSGRKYDVNSPHQRKQFIQMILVSFFIYIYVLVNDII